MKAHDAQYPEGRETKPFLEHLEDLRGTLFRCLTVLGLGMVIAFPAAPWILGLLKVPLVGLVENPDQFLKSLQVGGAFSVAMRITFWGGLLLSAPLLIYFIGAFIFPGLTRREQRVVLNALGFSIGLFALGVYIGYVLTLRVAFRFMLGFHRWLGVQAEWTVTSYVTFAIQLLLAFGLVFELPVVMVILGRLGIITSGQLREKRRHAIVAIFIMAMLLTPPDVISQVIMAIPMVLLYEICIVIIRFAEAKDRARPVAAT
jgi:sec-independent protein translocase protein TatC